MRLKLADYQIFQTNDSTKLLHNAEDVHAPLFLRVAFSTHTCVPTGGCTATKIGLQCYSDKTVVHNNTYHGHNLYST